MKIYLICFLCRFSFVVGYHNAKIHSSYVFACTKFCNNFKTHALKNSHNSQFDRSQPAPIEVVTPLGA